MAGLQQMTMPTARSAEGPIGAVHPVWGAISAEDGWQREKILYPADSRERKPNSGWAN